MCKIDGPQQDTINEAVRDEEPQVIDVGTYIPIWLESLSEEEYKKVIPSHLLITRYAYTG
jgi:hypothetical protein